MEYYLATKRNEILIHDTTRMNLENMLSEGKDAEATHCTIPFLWTAQNKHVDRDRKQISGGQGMQGRGEWGVIAGGYGVSFGEVLKMSWN